MNVYVFFINLFIYAIINYMHSIICIYCILLTNIKVFAIIMYTLIFKYMIKLKIKEISKKLNKSISDISRETGIHRNAISALVNEKVDGIKFETLEKLCQTYNLDLSNLLVYEPTPTTINKESKVYCQEGDLILFTLWPALFMFNQPDLRFVKKSMGEYECFFKNNYAWGYFRKNKMDEVARDVYNNYLDEKKFNEFYSTYLKSANALSQIYFDCEEKNIIEMNRSQLLAFCGDLMKKYKEFWSLSLFIDCFDGGFDYQEIDKIADKYKLTHEEIAILTTPKQMTFINEKELELLEIVKELKKKKSQIKNLSEYLDEFAATSDQVKTYIKKYDYFRSNYAHIEHITVQEVKDELLKYLYDNELFKSEYEKLKDYTINIEKAQQKVLHKHKMKINPLEFFARITYWKEHRKQSNLMGIHLLFGIMKSIELQTGIPLDYLKNSNVDEVSNILSGFIDADTLRKRGEEGFMTVINPDGHKIIFGKEAESLRDEIEKKMNDGGEDQIITGKVVSQGYAKGVARIVLGKEDFDKFQEGEILVTGMTRPEFVPLMKKAAAIVTNEGGITCHAAIVSRELRKPCIVGTQNALKVIKTGDLIEVRANHGTVRVLKRAGN